MKYARETTILAPLDVVVDIFANPDNMLYWHPELVSQEHTSGTARQAGAKTTLHFSTDRGEYDVVETIVANDLPNAFSAEYETVGKGVSSKIGYKFSSDEPDSTSCTMEVEHVVAGGFFLRWSAAVYSFIFKRKSAQSLQLFKEFVERDLRATGPSVAGRT